MKNRTQKFEELQEKFDTTRASMIEESKITFNETVKELFEEFPTLESFSWLYTPYFNDGDVCNFDVYADTPDINGVDGDDIGAEWEWNGEVHPARNPQLVPLQKAVSAFIESAPQEMLKSVFGDHVAVTINRDGTTETDEHSHD